ncbi:MAG TPA: hypothetical protein VGF90_03400 [Verrucomicrobiae bacterium]
MIKSVLTITTLSLFAAAIVAMPVSAKAQEATATNAPAAPAKHKKHDHSVFNGKLSAIDTKAMTLTVGERTFDITSDTKITKEGKPATLADGVVGETVGGAYKKGADGKLSATSIHFGAKAEGEKKHKKKSDAEPGSNTNSVPN